MPTNISAAQRGLFTIVTILYWTSMYIYVPTLSPYLKDSGYSLQFIGIVLGSYGFVQMLVRFPLGLFSDRWGKRKPFILLGMLTAAASCLLFVIPGSWIWPLAGRVIAGVCASTWVAFTVMYAGFFGSGGTGRAMGNISLMTVSGQMLGMLLSGWLTDRFSPDAPFLLGAAVAIAGLLLALLLRETPSERNGQSGMSVAKIASVVRDATLLRVSLLSILAHGVLFITMFGFTPLKAAELGANGTQLTLLVFSFMLPHAIASFGSAAWLVPRFGYWPTIAAGFVVSGICTGLMAAAPSLEWLYVTQAVNGLAQGLHLPLLLGLAIRDVDGSSRATAMGMYQALYAIGMFSGPFLAGWLNESWGLDSGFLFGAMLAAAASLLVWRWAARDRRRERPRSAPSRPKD
ncbi:MFS transporter [Paenibacillus sp. LHD-117]|uniref:MFS transporter n=1 Tax=Paenibacillus sp. LHD-117 TaxID=3071412 RepID=UPI0027DFAE3C|nr:MFS transporter [Paenibacillus sp. LHD-117]MDQ6419166.1 MFS transporter [Paenibacillus sp. LHD-117]